MNWNTTYFLKKGREKLLHKRKWPISFQHTKIPYMLFVAFFCRLFEIDANCCHFFPSHFFQCNDKDQIKLFILEILTMNHEMIFNWPVYQMVKEKTISFRTRRYNTISFSNHTSITIIQNNNKKNTLPKRIRAHSFLVLPFCLLFWHLFRPPFQTFSFLFCFVYFCKNMKWTEKKWSAFIILPVNPGAHV